MGTTPCWLWFLIFFYIQGTSYGRQDSTHFLWCWIYSGVFSKRDWKKSFVNGEQILIAEESLQWHSGLKIQLQQLGSLQRWGFSPWPGTVGERLQRCHGCGSDPIPGPGTSTCHWVWPLPPPQKKIPNFLKTYEVPGTKDRSFPWIMQFS